jgi:hypothetical protein
MIADFRLPIFDWSFAIGDFRLPIVDRTPAWQALPLTFSGHQRTSVNRESPITNRK